MSPDEHLLDILGEEGAEIAVAVSKANRFGLDEVNITKPDGPNNRDRLVDELNDLVAVADMLAERGIIPRDWRDPAKQAAKKEKVLRFMEYAERLGTIIVEPHQRFSV